MENRASAGGRLDDPTDDGRLALAAALSCRPEAGDQRGITPRADELARPVPRRDRTRDGKDA